MDPKLYADFRPHLSKRFGSVGVTRDFYGLEWQVLAYPARSDANKRALRVRSTRSVPDSKRESYQLRADILRWRIVIARF